MKLWIKIFIALVLGIVVGAFLGPQAAYLKPVGQIFLRLISMIIVLLVLSSITVGITSINDPEKLSRVGLKSLFLYLATTLIAIGFGITLASVFKPGADLGFVASTVIETQEAPALTDLLLTVIPSNPIVSLVEGNVLQIIVFAIFLGLAINYAGPKGKPLLSVMESLADVMYRLTTIVMEFSPIGVFALMAWVAGSFGMAVLLPLFKFLALYYLACFLHMAIVYCGMLKFIAKLNPWPFFRGMGDAIMMAFSTCSSSATLPLTMQCAQENVGISRNIASFLLPLGATINMNGAALFQGMSAIFIAQAYGMDLSYYTIMIIVVTATMAAIGAAGIPGTGFIMLTVVFTSAGIPLEGLAILAGIDRVREMISTVLNVLGDTVCAVVVAKQEGELDETCYYQEKLVELKEV